ncbi:MAG TPA: TIGR03862 family flavoprotein [Hyphomicrobiaceae bacterium]|jgi:uncharacterized flavoprotein (TIGR03862 family)
MQRAPDSVRNNSSFNIAVIGGGPAGLMAAEVIAAGGARVTVYDGMASLGRKFLLAGRGGLNLTHSEDLDRLMGRYGAAAARLRPAIDAFPPAALRAWCEGLGQATFIGSSGRVFPKSMKTSPLLRAWLRRLAAAGVDFKPRHRWTGWDEAGALTFATPDGPVSTKADATVLALGGASWPQLGSSGDWVDILSAAGIVVMPLQPANCGFLVPWSETFRSRFAGQPLKRLELSFSARKAPGEALITATGLEGGGVYALSGPLREAIAASGEAIVHIDLRPELTLDRLEQKLAAPRAKQSVSTFLRKAASLSPAAVGLLHEAAMAASLRVSAMTPAALAQLIKAVPVRLTGTAPLARAISTAGGITLEEVDDRFMLRHLPGVFAAGEMLDWDAPTGGYLLQACFATGAAAGRGALQWLERRPLD